MTASQHDSEFVAPDVRLTPLPRAARAAGVGEKTIKRWIKDGLLSSVLIHGRHYVKVASLHHLLTHGAP